MELLKSELYGAVFVIIFGTIWHFAYLFSGKNRLVGYISPVNESVWEHLKLLFFPSLIYAIGQYFFFAKEYDNFFSGKVFGVALGMLAMIALFYGYTAATGKSIVVVDIIIFILSVVASSAFTLNYIENCKPHTYAAAIVLAVIIFAFIIFTYNPPPLAIFRDSSKKITAKR